MGLFHQYISRSLNPTQIEAERRQHLARIGQVLGCDVITYAARLTNAPAGLPTAILYDDLLPFVDLLDGLTGKAVAVILETNGGIGEVGRQMVEILHERFEDVKFIVPGTAKSTGTIMVLGGHEILMGPGSSLGPIDAQLQQDGKTYSADALIEGLNRIKQEVEESGGQLNPTYIPFLQKLSPGEIEHAHNALEFARATVRDWLVRYKFGKWEVRETSGTPVTADYKQQRAADISRSLASQATWHTHGRALRIPDLRALGLQITDFTDNPPLSDAIQRYNILLRLTFDRTNIYKLFETPLAVVAYRFNIDAPKGATPPAPPAPGLAPGDKVGRVMVDMDCNNCHEKALIQLDFEPGEALEPGAQRYPNSGVVACKRCGQHIQLAPVRAQVEQQIGRNALNPQPEA